MDLIFDRGTILFENLPEGIDFSGYPKIIWDERVERYRAPADHYWPIVAHLKRRSVQFTDLVCNSKKLTGHWNAKTQLRPYQEAALRAWSIAENRGIIVLPTGSGKTRVAIAAMAQIGESALCLVPTKVLLEQWHAQLKDSYSGTIGIYGDGTHEIGEITIATYESAYRNIAQLGNRFETIIADEVHHFGNGIRDEIFEMSTAKHRLGLTATVPKKAEQIEKLNRYIGAPVYELAIADLSGSFLAQFDLYSLHLDMNEEERKLYERNISLFRSYFKKFKAACPEASWLDFVRIANQGIEGRAAIKGLQAAKKITNFASSKAATLASLLARHRGQRTLVFTADAETAYSISREYLIAPITSEIGRKEREEMLAQFRVGKINALVSCRVLNEGFDVPDAEVAIIVGGTHGEREHLQRIGRILRPSTGKKAIVYELICRDTVEVRQAKKRNETIAFRKTAPIFH